MSNRIRDCLPTFRNWLAILLGGLSLLGLYAISRYNFLVFHCLAEAFSIIIAIAVFAIFWNTRQYLENGIYLVIGFGCLFAGMLDVIYIFGYKGMSVFPGAIRKCRAAGEDRRPMVREPVVRLCVLVSAAQGPSGFGPVRLQRARGAGTGVHILLASLPGLLCGRRGANALRKNGARHKLQRLSRRRRPADRQPA